MLLAGRLNCVPILGKTELGLKLRLKKEINRAQRARRVDPNVTYCTLHIFLKFGFSPSSARIEWLKSTSLGWFANPVTKAAALGTHPCS